MAKEARHYYYPIRNYPDSRGVTLLEITEDLYRALYPEIWRTQKQERKLGRCVCPVSKLWKCDGDCLICPHHIPGKIWSLDQDLEIMGDHIAESGSLLDDEVADRILHEKILKRLQSLCPEALDVAERKADGLSERSSLEELGLTRTSFRRHLKNARTILEKEFDEDF